MMVTKVFFFRNIKCEDVLHLFKAHSLQQTFNLVSRSAGGCSAGVRTVCKQASCIWCSLILCDVWGSYYLPDTIPNIGGTVRKASAFAALNLKWRAIGDEQASKKMENIRQ